MITFCGLSSTLFMVHFNKQMLFLNNIHLICLSTYDLIFMSSLRNASLCKVRKLFSSIVFFKIF